MDSYKEIVDVYRVSLASITKPDGFIEKPIKEEKPRDSFLLGHVLCLFLGLLNLLPLTFFITANGYWMYKFRDTAKDEVDLNNKTTLQAYFVSGSMIVQTVPSTVTMLLSTTFGRKFSVHSRIVATLALVIIIFIIFTVFINVNTDSWQLGFFILSLLGLSLITGTLNLFQVSCLAIIPKFPPIYMKTFLFGQGVAGIFSSLLQIISLALGTSTKTSAMFYFVSGTVVVIITLVLYLICQYLPFYQYYMNINLEEVKKTYSRAEIKAAFYQVWSVLAILAVVFLSLYLSHPSVTALIVSENYGNGNQWNDIYFVPTITFFFGEICSLAGRLLSRPVITKSSGPWILGLTTLRMFILVPLIWLCNAHPRSNLPVLLPHDWQYILICVVNSTTYGFLLSTVVLSIPTLAPGNEDLAFLVMMSGIGVTAGLLSPISLVAVRIL